MSSSSSLNRATCWPKTSVHTRLIDSASATTRFGSENQISSMRQLLDSAQVAHFLTVPDKIYSCRRCPASPPQEEEELRIRCRSAAQQWTSTEPRSWLLRSPGLTHGGSRPVREPTLKRRYWERRSTSRRSRLSPISRVELDGRGFSATLI